jgi:hypothetical protein
MDVRLPHREGVGGASVADGASPPLDAASRTLVGLEVLLAIGAFGGAAGLISGAIDLQESTTDLPLQSPVLGGVALGLINGVLPTVAVMGALTRRSWAPLAHLAVGAALIGWIVVQVGFIGFGSWLQAFYALYGAAITGLALSLRPWRG